MSWGFKEVHDLKDSRKVFLAGGHSRLNGSVMKRTGLLRTGETFSEMVVTGARTEKPTGIGSYLTT